MQQQLQQQQVRQLLQRVARLAYSRLQTGASSLVVRCFCAGKTSRAACLVQVHLLYEAYVRDGNRRSTGEVEGGHGFRVRSLPLTATRAAGLDPAGLPATPPPSWQSEPLQYAILRHLRINKDFAEGWAPR